MNVLFYVEPLIELEKPTFKEGWLNGICSHIIDSLAEKSYHFTMVLNEALTARYNGSNQVQVVTIRQYELLNHMKYNQLDLLATWNLGSYTDEQLSYYVAIMKDKLGGLPQPDVILTFTPVPFLKHVFPEALILHMEYSIFSRKPFPESWYFDPVGMNGGAYLSQYWPQVRDNLTPKEDDLQKVSEIKQTIQNLIREKSPFRDKMSFYKDKFKYIVLLPLQFSRFYLFDSLTNYVSQFDYLIDVLEKVPSNIGVVVTTHPEYNFLTHETIAFLRMNYPHFIYDEDFELYYASSQYLIAETDAVITVSSSLGLQTLLWDKKLISLGTGFLSFMADSKTLDEIELVLQREAINKDDVLFWILTHYVISKKRILDSDWLDTFFKRAVFNYKTMNDLSLFYEPFEDGDTVISELIDQLDENIPESKNKSTIFQCYFDYGLGFLEEDSHRQIVKLGQNELEIPIQHAQIKLIRLDPVNSPCVVKMGKVIIHTEAGEIELKVSQTNAEYFHDDKYYFLNDDPYLILKTSWDNQPIKKLVVRMLLEVIGQPDPKELVEVLNIKDKDLNIKNHELKVAEDESDLLKREIVKVQERSELLLSELESVNKELIASTLTENNLKNELNIKNNELNQKNQQLEEQLQHVEQIEQELSVILTSNSWKLTEPLRKVRRIIKKET